MTQKPKAGTVVWRDLTVKDAENVSSFYQEVIGWEKKPISMGDYDDYAMKAPGTEEAVGICHAKGANAYIPPQWLMYITVDDLDQSLEKCVELGGKVIGEKRKWGDNTYCLIQDPAGAHVMLWG